MEETYTFSTALRMMRYGGKIMKKQNESYGVFGYAVFHNELFWRIGDSWVKVCALGSDEIMGSWVEVKE